MVIRLLRAVSMVTSSLWLMMASVAGVASLAIAHEMEPAQVITRHQMTVGGRPLKYTAEAGHIAIRDVATGEPHAQMFYTAYRIESPTKGRRRPIAFLWGGGPGGASASMNFAMAGPLRADTFEGAGDRLVENPQTWLTDTDLVFADEVGTGYSRPTKAEYAKEFNGTIGDTLSFTEFVRCWLIQHNAEDAPVFVGGGSWGTPRAATVGYALLKRGIALHGVVMMVGETSLNNAYISPQLFEGLRVVGMAEIAFRYHKLAPELGQDFAHIAPEVDAWVRSTYVPALQRSSTLTAAERAKVIAGLTRFTAIPVDCVDSQTLEITPKRFRECLLREEGKTLYHADVRLTEPPQPFRWPPAAQRYIKYDMGYHTDLPYFMGLNPQDLRQGYAPFGEYPAVAGEDWEWATTPVTREVKEEALKRAAARQSGPPIIGEPLPATEEAITLNPRMKVLVIIARYDGESTCPSNAELQRNMPDRLKQAMIFRCYESGHQIYRTPGMLSLLKDDAVAMMGSAGYAPAPDQSR